MRAVVLLAMLSLLPARTSAAQEPGSKLSEDSRIVVSVDSTWRAQSIGGQSLGLGNWTFRVRAPNEVVSVWMTLVVVKGGHVGLTDKPRGEKANLVDTDGGEHKDLFIFAQYPPVEEIPEGVRKEIGEGATFVAIFEFPKAGTPVVLKWAYAYWDSPQSVEVEYAEIEIDLGAKDRPSPQ